MAREAKYTAVELEERIEEYFRRCRRTQPVTETVPLTEVLEGGERRVVTDDRGRPVLLERNVTSDAGEVMRSSDYLIPPTITGLCLFLGISRDTWSKYSKDKSRSGVCERAKLQVETYLQHRLLEKESARGAQFALEHNFGWKERKEISADPETQKVITAAGMSTREKAALMREMGWHMPGEESSEEVSEDDDSETDQPG